MAIILGVINGWDPYSFLEANSPQNEFDAKIALPARSISSVYSDGDATRISSSVFSSAFEPSLFQPTACSEAGNKLCNRLEKTGLLAKIEEIENI